MPPAPGQEHADTEDIRVQAPGKGDDADCERECRICLLADTPEDLVQPCACAGSVEWAHMGCLKQWAHENLTLKCELCAQVYRPNVIAELMPVLQDAQQAQMRADQGAGGRPSESGRPATGSDRRRAFDSIIIQHMHLQDPRRHVAGHPLGMSAEDPASAGTVNRMRRWRWGIIFWMGFLSFPLYWVVSAQFQAQHWSALARIGILVVCMLAPIIPFLLIRLCVQAFRRYRARAAARALHAPPAAAAVAEASVAEAAV